MRADLCLCRHRMFGDLLEAATKAGYQIPALPKPTPGPPLHARAAAQHVPDSILQHPGYYYYLAGLCAVRRRQCYKAAEASFKQSEVEGTVTKAPTALTHERAVPHAEQIVELFSKAYEFFKREKATRVTLYLADQISAVHSDTGNKEMAQKFDDRISRTYRREGWLHVLDSILAREVTDASSGQSSEGDKADPDMSGIFRKYLKRMALHGVHLDRTLLRLLWWRDQLIKWVFSSSKALKPPMAWTC